MVMSNCNCFSLSNNPNGVQLKQKQFANKNTQKSIFVQSNSKFKIILLSRLIYSPQEKAKL
jgi:hypothetical protein